LGVENCCRGKLLTLGGPIASLRAPMNLLAGVLQVVRAVVVD